MARIYFNCPQTLQSLQWNVLQQGVSARQITAAVLCVVTIALLLFGLIEIYVIGYTDVSQDTVYKPLSQRSHLSHKGNAYYSLGPDVQYGIVIDCGSSGSRVYIYFWPPHSGNPSDLLNVQQLMGKDGKPAVKKITPGLDKFAENPGAASDYIKPLLTYAAKYIPQAQQKETLLFILATAGMRMIPVTAQKMIFDDLKTDIPKDFPFVISESNLEVISGKLEGVYAWIAVNYALRRFDHGEDDHPLVAIEVPGLAGKKTHIRRRTVGMIDMGGGSMQIAFEVTSKSVSVPKYRLAEFNLGCQNNDIDHTYRVYITSFLGFGANEARERYEQLLIENADHSNVTYSFSTPADSGNQSGISHIHHHHGKRVLFDPCLPVGMLHESKDEQGHVHFFRGIGDYLACREAVFPLLNLSSPCEMADCSMNGVHQPSIPYYSSEFYGFSEFWYTMQDVFRKGGSYDYENFEKEAIKFCTTKWSLLQSWHEQKLYPQADDARMRLQCFKSAWMTSVLHRGLKFPTDYKQFRSVQLINNRDVQWTMGALIHRTRFLPLRSIEKLVNQRSRPAKRNFSLYNGYGVVFCFIVVLIAIWLYLKHLKLCPRSSEMKRVPSRSYFNVDESQVEQGLPLTQGYQYA